jgi:hypothetical protein
MLHLVKHINKVEPFTINVLFNTGETKTVDFSQRLKDWSKSDNSKFKDLLNPDYFITVKLNADLETVYWDNGIDFCPDSLYNWGI